MYKDTTDVFVHEFIVCRDIPVDFKYIADPSMHSMPAVALSPNGKHVLCIVNTAAVTKVLIQFSLSLVCMFSFSLLPAC